MDTGAGGRSGDAFSCATSYIDQGTQPWPVQVLRIYGRELQTSTTISMLADDILLEHLTSVETTTPGIGSYWCTLSEMATDRICVTTRSRSQSYLCKQNACQKHLGI